MDLCNCKPQPQSGFALAIPSVPIQPWEQPFDPKKGLEEGTIFPSLDLPFYVTGGARP